MEKQDINTNQKLQLRYFQEDVVFFLCLIATILCFGFEFKVFGYILVFYTVGQKIYASIFCYKFEKSEKDG